MKKKHIQRKFNFNILYSYFLSVGAKEVIVDGDQMRVKLDGLSPATKYVFHVRAENRVGKSKTSTSLYQTTLEEAPSASPLNIRVSFFYLNLISISLMHKFLLTDFDFFLYFLIISQSNFAFCFRFLNVTEL